MTTDHDESMLTELLRLRNSQADAREALGHISGLLRRHFCVIRDDRAAEMDSDIRAALAIADWTIRDLRAMS